MNHILHNISLIILCCGIILITIYLTKATSNNYLTQNQQLLVAQTGLRRKEYSDSIYNMRPSNIFTKMFNQASIGVGYESFNTNNQTEKIYIKSKNI